MNKRIQCFISYSHDDESHKNNLIKFMAQLKREGLVSEWHDRALSPGGRLNEEIKENLEHSDIIILLLSQDFINSYYCYEVEFLSAIERARNGKSRVFPIVIRPCDWKNTEITEYYIFNDGKPATTDVNIDEFWLRAAADLRKLCEKQLSEKEAHTSKVASHIERLELKKKVEELEDTKIKFSNAFMEKILLSSTFVWPDIKPLLNSKNSTNLIFSSKDIVDRNNFSKHCLIIGEDQTGKSALSQMIALEGIKNNKYIVHTQGSDIKTSKNLSEIEKITKKLYGKDESIFAETTLIIDDFDKCKISDNYKCSFINRCLKNFGRVIVFISEEIGPLDDIVKCFDTYMVAEILPFSVKLRSNLITKWYSAGQEELMVAEELESKHDAAQSKIEQIIKKQTVPSHPVYLLMILQTLEGTSSSELQLSSYGHCYHKLIIQALERTKIRAADFDSFINLLSELSFYIYKRNKQSLSPLEKEDFIKKYNEKYIMAHSDGIEKLIDSGLLKETLDGIQISYKYILFYCIGKIISESPPSVMEIEIKNLLEELHLESSANILIFVTHHTKSQEIIDSITLKVMEIFEEEPEAELSFDDFGHLDEIAQEIPSLVLEQRNAKEERNKVLEKQDKIEKEELLKSNSEEEDFQIKNDHQRQSAQAYRAVEILGQILRNRRGSFTKEQLLQLSDEAVGVGLRFLKYYLIIAKSIRSEVIDLIYKHITEKDSTDEEIEKEARQYLWILSYLMSYAVIKRISNVIGSAELIPVFNLLADRKRKRNEYSFARRMCDISIKMYFSKIIPKENIEELYEDLKSYPVTKRLLQEFVVQHIYMHTVPYKDKQWIANKLEIPIKSQNVIALRSG